MNRATQEDVDFVDGDEHGYADDDDDDVDSPEASDFVVSNEEAQREEDEANAEYYSDGDAGDPVLVEPAMSEPALRGRPEEQASSAGRSDQSPKRKKVSDETGSVSTTSKKLNDILELTTTLPHLIRTLQNEEFKADDPYYSAQIKTLQRRKDLSKALSVYLDNEAQTNSKMVDLSAKVVRLLRELHKLMELYRDYHFKAFCGSEATRKNEQEKLNKKKSALEAKNEDAQSRAKSKEETEKIALEIEKKELEASMKTERYMIQPNDSARVIKEKKALVSSAEAEITRINVKLLQITNKSKDITAANLRSLPDAISAMNINKPKTKPKPKPKPKPTSGAKSNLMNLRPDEMWQVLNDAFHGGKIDKSAPWRVQYDLQLEYVDARYNIDNFVSRLNSYLGYHRGSFNHLCEEIEKARSVPPDYASSIRFMLEYMIAKQGFGIMHRTLGPKREEMDKVYQQYNNAGAQSPQVDQ